MLMQLPKEFHPDFIDTSQKPSFPVEIDWSNSLSAGLLLVYIPQMNALFTIGADGRLTVVGDEPVFKINKNTVCAEHGLSDGSAVSTDSAYIANNAAKTSNEYTFVVRSRPNNSSDDGDYFSSIAQTFISNRSSSNKGFSYSQIGAVGGSPNPGRQQFTIHGLADYTASAYNLNGSDFQTHGVSVSTNGDVGFYTDGQLKQSISVGSFTAGETNWLIGGQGPSASPISNRRCYSNIEFIFVYSRKLSDKEWHNVNKNPYQILKPKSDLWLPLGAGGAGGTVVDLSLTDTATTPAIDSIVLQQISNLNLSDLATTPAINSIVLQQTIELALSGLATTPAIDPIVLDVVVGEVYLALSDLATTPAIDPVNIQQNVNAVLSEMAVAPSIDAMDIAAVVQVLLADCAANTAIDALPLSLTHHLPLSDTAITPAIGGLGLSQIANLHLAKMAVTPLVESMLLWREGENQGLSGAITAEAINSEILVTRIKSDANISAMLIPNTITAEMVYV